MPVNKKTDRKSEIAQEANKMNQEVEMRKSPFGGEMANGSRNPLDAVAHWSWKNPLNVLVYGMVALTVAAIVLALF